MVTAAKTVRVFVSSTFRDMHAERDHLNRFVFPELRQRCLRRGADFLGVDLRWGVTEEEARRVGALRICLEEVDRCRPFFLCLLGDRYGWSPPPEDVPREPFERCRSQAPWLDEWYRLDETSEPPVYRLRRDVPLPDDVAGALVRFWEEQELPHAGESITAREIHYAALEEGRPRTHGLFYLRRGVHAHPDFPPALLPLFVEQDAVRQGKLEALKDRIRQQGGRLIVRDYQAEYAGLRIEPALLPAELTARDQAALTGGALRPAELAGLSAAAQRAVQEHGTAALAGMEELGRQVLADLWAAIEVELVRPAPVRDAHERQRAHHERFVVERTRLFCGRQEQLGRLLDHAGDKGNRRPLVVTGLPGCGKSALLAEFARQCRERFPTALVLPHFIGAAPGSTDLLASLRSLCEALRRDGQLREPVPAEAEKLRRGWPDFLAGAARRRPVILILDALNQLDATGRAHELDWFPFEAPPGARVITSTLAGPCLDRLRERLPADHLLELPVLPADDRHSLVEQHLALRRKRLAAGQTTRLLDTAARPDAGLPLYLLVALEELCLFGDYQALDERIDRLPPMLPELFGQVLARLEQDHGRTLTEAVCRWLAGSRSGLRESEIIDLLGSLQAGIPPARWTHLYRALQFYLRPMGEDDAERDSGLVDFYHDQLRLAVRHRYLGAGPEELRRTHQELAGYFRAQGCAGGEPPRWRADRPRALGELPYHLLHAGLWEELGRTLCDLGHVEARCAAGMVYDLSADLGAALTAPDCPPDLRGPLADFGRFLGGQAHLLARNPALTFAQAFHEPDGSAPGRAARARWQAGAEVRPWLRRVNQPQERSAALRTFAGAPYRVFCCAFAPDGRRIVSGSRDGTLKVWDAATGLERATLAGWRGDVVSFSLDGRRILSGGGSWVRMWDAASGVELEAAPRPWDIEDLEVRAFSQDGKWLASVSRRTLTLWDTATRSAIGRARLRAAWSRSSASSDFFHLAPLCLFSPDGARLVTSRNSPRLTVWDVPTLRKRATLGPRWGKKITCCTFLPGGDRLVAGEYRGVSKLWEAAIDLLAAGEYRDLLKLWDLTTGKQLGAFRGPPEGVIACCAASPDGTRLAAGVGAVLLLWEVDGQKLLATFRGHTDEVACCAFSPDGRRLLSASHDETLKLWDVESMAQAAGPGHDGRVTTCAFLPDGRLVSASADGTLKVWEGTTGAEAATVRAHRRPVAGLAVSPDGQRLLTGSPDGSLKLWGPDMGQPIHTLSGLIGVRPSEILHPGRYLLYLALLLAAGLCAGCLGRVINPVVEWLWEALARGSPPDPASLFWGLLALLALLPLLLMPVLLWDGRKVIACAFAPDGRRIVWGTRSGKQTVYDLVEGKITCRIPGDGHGVDDCFFSSDGGLVVTRSRRSVTLWDAVTGAQRASFRRSESEFSSFHACALSPDGRFLAAALNNGSVLIWDAATAEPARTPEEEKRAYRLATLALLKTHGLTTLAGEGRPVRGCAFSPDGRRLAWVSDAGVLRVRDMATGDTTEYWTDRQLRAVCWAPDGCGLAAGDSIGGIHLLRLENVRAGRSAP